jgi:hypothetical protein
VLETTPEFARVRPTTGNAGGLEFWVERRKLKTGAGTNPQNVQSAVDRFQSHSVDMRAYRCSAALQQALGIGTGHGNANEWMADLQAAGGGVSRDAAGPGTLVFYRTSQPEGHIGVMAYDSEGRLRMISQKNGRITWETPPGNAVFANP